MIRYTEKYIIKYDNISLNGPWARGAKVIAVGNEYVKPSSNLGQYWHPHLKGRETAL